MVKYSEVSPVVTAFVFITTKVGREGDVLGKLMKKKMVREASAVYGDFDIVAKLETDDLDKLNEFIIKDVRETEGVSETNTLIAL